MRTLASLHHPWLGEPAKRTTTKANSSQEHHARDDQSHQCKVTSYLSSTNTTKEQKKVNNPYVKASKSASANSTEERSAAATSSSTITSEVGIEKFFVTKRGVGEAKPSAAQTLVSPGKTDAQVRGLKMPNRGVRNNTARNVCWDSRAMTMTAICTIIRMRTQAQAML